METKDKTFDVELFIHQNNYGELTVFTCDMSEHGHILLDTQTVTLKIPTKDPIKAEMEMLHKKIYIMEQRKKDLLCLEVKDG